MSEFKNTYTVTENRLSRKYAFVCLTYNKLFDTDSGMKKYNLEFFTDLKLDDQKQWKILLQDLLAYVNLTYPDCSNTGKMSSNSEIPNNWLCECGFDLRNNIPQHAESGFSIVSCNKCGAGSRWIFEDNSWKKDPVFYGVPKPRKLKPVDENCLGKPILAKWHSRIIGSANKDWEEVILTGIEGFQFDFSIPRLSMHVSRSEETCSLQRIEYYDYGDGGNYL